MSYTLSSGNLASKILYINSEDASQYLATKLNSDGTTSTLNCYFNYTIKENIEVPANQRAIISLNSATIPYSFYNIRTDVNDTTGLNWSPNWLSYSPTNNGLNGTAIVWITLWFTTIISVVSGLKTCVVCVWLL